MPVKITKEFRWEMGHRLPNHDGGCNNIHGHSYRLVVEIEGEPDDAGMIVDYHDISRAVRPILDELDHAFLCDSSDDLMSDVLRESNLKYVTVPFATTAENIAKWLAERVYPSFSSRSNLRSFSIHVYETLKTSATYTINVGDLG